MSENWEGYLGTALVIVAYVPQLVRLVKAHCSTGISVAAYAMWTGSSVLLLIHAIQIASPVFTSIAVAFTVAATRPLGKCARSRRRI